MAENGRSGRRKRRRLKGWVRLTLLGLLLTVLVTLLVNLLITGNTLEEAAEPIVDAVTEPEKTNITISAAGDFTLGTDETFTYAGSFPDEVERSGLGHFTEGLDGIFQHDDLSTVNLETTLTDATEKAAKKFRFKGDPSYTQILTDAGIESVNLANNHIFDYLQKGYKDTKTNLEKANIGYSGYGDTYVTEIKGVKVGVLGYEGWDDTAEVRDQAESDILAMREDGVAIIVVHYHWGIERSYVPEESQRSLAQFTVDAGADLIVGHHPHVVQGIEEYNGKFIVYSLGNFMFGGNRNPSDKDSFVFQQTFHLEDGQVTEQQDIDIVPFSISSRSDRNDYQPTKLDGAEKERVMEKIIDVSNEIEEADWLERFTEQ